MKPNKKELDLFLQLCVLKKKNRNNTKNGVGEEGNKILGRFEILRKVHENVKKKVIKCQ